MTTTTRPDFGLLLAALTLTRLAVVLTPPRHLGRTK